ncbi:MAG: hypothetical protein M3072_09325 [Candidatus Dormibacteraeota bacterium]|nr:hypothetical protein [Candidatus Dormibacteraeota bacterium]
MADRYVFSDEAGDLEFSQKSSSRYWIVTTVTASTWTAGDALLNLRRRLAWQGVDAHPEFRASEELQPVRDRVFQVLQEHDFRVDATIFDKRKVVPHRRERADRFYGFAWYFHLKRLAPRITVAGDRLLLVPATLGRTRAKQEVFSQAVRSVVDQVVNPKVEVRCAFWMARSDPCLWVADYCSWAIQRKWEHKWQGQPDARSHQLIAAKIRSEFDIFAIGTKTYY